MVRLTQLVQQLLVPQMKLLVRQMKPLVRQMMVLVPPMMGLVPTMRGVRRTTRDSSSGERAFALCPRDVLRRGTRLQA